MSAADDDLDLPDLEKEMTAQQEAATPADGEEKEEPVEHAAKAVEAIARTLPKLAEAHQRLALDLRKEATGLALVIGRALAHELLRRQPETEVAAMVTKALATLGDMAEQARTVIKVAPPVLDAVRALLAQELASRPGMKVQLEADPALVGSACRVAWPEGGAERDPAQIEREATEAVTRYLAVSGDMPQFQGPAGAGDDGPGAGPDVQAAITKVALAAAEQAAAVADETRPAAAAGTGAGAAPQG